MTPVMATVAARIFLAYAFAYFFSALLRAVTATLAPQFSQELNLQAADLGLLAGAYFLGFSMLQLPLGTALDRWGPRRVQLSLMVVGVVGCCAFAMAGGLASLFLSRLLIGMGLAACLMAPLTSFRHRFSPSAQLRANSWMLMTGSLGMLASTLPVQGLLPVIGWRGLFWLMAACLVASMWVIWRVVPMDSSDLRVTAEPAGSSSTVRNEVSPASGFWSGYRSVFRHPSFVRCMPLGFFTYGGMVAIQALWAGPWLTQVAGWSPQEAAGGLFFINACMLFAFMAWGTFMPRLLARGWDANRLMVYVLPLSLLVLAGILIWPEPVGAPAWAVWCVLCTCVSLSQPALAQAFPPSLAGRALSAFNLVIFLGIFSLQWGIGLTVDLLMSSGMPEPQAFRWALSLFACTCVASYLWFLGYPRPEDNAPSSVLQH